MSEWYQFKKDAAHWKSEKRSVRRILRTICEMRSLKTGIKADALYKHILERKGFWASIEHARVICPDRARGLTDVLSVHIRDLEQYLRPSPPTPETPPSES